MARYHDIADDLRKRIKAGEWQIGDKLPGISALQEHYQVEKSLGTIRSAQQLLVADGMLRTEQGVGAFVIAREPNRRETDPAVTLGEIRDLANHGLAAIQFSRQQAKRTKGKVTFDVMDDEQFYVLDEALREFASNARFQADNDGDGNPDSHRRWAEVADRLRAEIDAALP